MKIGHWGRTRVEEIILAVVLLIIAVRTALPLGPSAYNSLVVKMAFAFLTAAPAVWLLLARGLPQRKKALLGVVIAYTFTGLLVVYVDWTRFAVGSALLGLGALSGYLYYLTAREIKWAQQNSLPL